MLQALHHWTTVLQALHHWTTVLQALHHWTTVLQGLQVMIATDNSTVVSVFPETGQDKFPCPVMSSCGFYSVASISPVTVN